MLRSPFAMELSRIPAPLIWLGRVAAGVSLLVILLWALAPSFSRHAGAPMTRPEWLHGVIHR